MEDKFQGCLALSQGKIRNDKSCFRRLQWLSALFQRKSALKQHWFRADFFALNFCFFSAVSEKISAVQLCFRENSAETALIQRWFFALKNWCSSAVSEKISSVSEKISAETALIQRWFFCSENFLVQSCFRQNQRCSALNQLCLRANQRCFSADF